MKLLILAAIATLAAPCTAPAAPGESRSYEFQAEKIEFVDEPASHLTVSKGCLNKKSGSTPHCAATKNLSNLSLKKIQAAHPGTESAASLLCEEQLKGVVVIGKSKIGDENAFCRFPADSSLIDLGSLLYRARQNDKPAPKI